MQTGVLSSENLSQVLRGISQRRQHGTLEVSFVDRKSIIVFFQGKIVDTQHSDQSAAFEVLRSLQQAGYLDSDFFTEADSYQELFDSIVQQADRKNQFSEAVFKEAVKHRILDRLYCMEFGSGAYYNFKVQMVEQDRALLPAISVGQLLLDMVSLEAGAERFDEIFPMDALLKKALVTDMFLAEEEQRIYGLIGSGIRVSELISRSMLSRYHIQESLLGLYEREMLLVETGENTSSKEAASSGLDVSGIVEALEQSVAASLGVPLPLCDDDSVEAYTGFDFPAESRITDQDEEDDEDDEDSEDDGEEVDYQIDLKSKVGLWSAKLLHSSLICHLVVFCFLAVSLLAPLFYWGEVFKTFGRF